VTHKPDSYCGVENCALCLRKAEDALAECGCCSAYHEVGYTGECRDDRYRFASPESYRYWKVTGRRDDLSQAALTRLGLEA
jgi:hypothetical protein